MLCAFTWLKVVEGHCQTAHTAVRTPCAEQETPDGSLKPQFCARGRGPENGVYRLLSAYSQANKDQLHMRSGYSVTRNLILL